MVRLVLPSTRYKHSYIEATREFQQENNTRASNYLKLDIDNLKKDFASYVNLLHDYSQGKNLPEGFVAATEFWIINDQDLYLGRVSIRHYLNDYLKKAGGHIGYNIRLSQRRKGYGSQALKLGLIEAKKLGINRALLTCDEDNIASIKIIEKKGGVLENIIIHNGHNKRRYWIDLV